MGSPDLTTGVITIDVPIADVGGAGPGSRLIDATGFSLVDRAAGTGSTTPALADQADVTAAFDDQLPGGPPRALPEAPGAALIVVIAALSAALWRRRRGATSM